jgi:type VI secretion system protein ImpK
MATDIDDPFGLKDSTIIRPRPGRRPPVDLTASGPTASTGGDPDPLTGSVRDTLGRGLNPLVQAASPLLLLAGQLRQTPSHGDVGGLRRHVVDEIRRFESRAREHAPQEVVMAARYALCAALDEAVLSTPWGGHSEWAQQSLLIALHREAWGGQKFFDMLERISPDPGRHIDLMELQYLCLAVGFAGKYQIAERGQAQLSEVQHTLHRKIRDQRGTPPTELSLRWKGREDRRNPVLRYVPWWVAGLAALAVLSLTFVLLYSRLASAAAPIHGELATIGTEQYTKPVPAARSGPTLKQLLAGEEAQGVVSVEEEGGRTTVTLLAPELFASGSDRLSASAVATVSRVAQAVRQVPGPVLVVGHTDDQPIRSIRFQDNFALSKARAESVAALLKREVDASRIKANGVGATQPRYQPETAAENRARNRRVEIVHVATS